jgi:hypothetical protein
MKITKQFLLFSLFLLCLVSLTACEQPVDEPGPGPGGGFQRCIPSPSTEMVGADSSYYYQYCDGCCWRSGAGVNQWVEPVQLTKNFRPGTFCYHPFNNPNESFGRTPCDELADDPECRNCTGSGTQRVLASTKALLLRQYPDLEWAIDQGFFSMRGQSR